MTDNPQEPSAPEQPGWLTRVFVWSKATAARAADWAVDARGRHASVDVGFRAADRNRRVAAMVLSGGIAYRVFFWLLALSLVFGGVLGFVDTADLELTLTEQGFGVWLAAAVTRFARSADGNEWWLLLVGVWLVLWTGYTCTKALVLAHAAIWHVDPPKIGKPFRTSLIFNGLALGFIAAMAGARWLREENDLVGHAATLLVFVLPFVFWLWASHVLPNRAAGWRDLLPGAAVVAVGLQAMHLFTAYFLGPKLASATELYGVLGITTTILFWFYIAGRLIVTGATLDASLAERRAAQA